MSLPVKWGLELCSPARLKAAVEAQTGVEERGRQEVHA